MPDSSTECDFTISGFRDTELTLRLPGHPERPSPPVFENQDDNTNTTKRPQSPEEEMLITGNSGHPATKSQAVGWPPLRSQRKKAVERRRYVKVAMDGAPYLRKVDIGLYGSYKELLKALHHMFACFPTHGGDAIEVRMKEEEGSKGYVPTYEDKDGDWMLVGDVPWKMFAESCRRIRLMNATGAQGLGLVLAPTWEVKTRG